MKLKILIESEITHYKIAAVMEGDECETEIFLNELPEKYQASADGLFRLIEHIVERGGLDGLSPKQCHLVDKDHKILELIKGDIRLLFFKGHGDTIIVTTHAFIKKTQKTPENHKNKAIRYKKEYQSAHDKNQIYFVKDEDE